ncbi:MAG: 3-phosphoshikimate 1-carboxyvinyltransferase [Crocinitomicaceae bacterium]|nr:3-phosphoshikimate 1-carboxyvinyltransferase [Crocinitomicaceae bacterium]
MMDYTVKKGNYSGCIHIPPSKSDSQRALLIASLGTGKSTLKNTGKSNDELAMLNNCQQLGVAIEWLDEKSILVTGNGLKSQNSIINCEESGLGFRLLTSIASLKSHEITITGVGSLLQRNHSFFEEFLPTMGVKVESNNGCAPIKICGPLKSGNYTVDGSASSQYISGLLIAFSQIEGTTQLKIDNCKSKPYIDMTIHTLSCFGISILELSGDVYQIEGKQRVQLVEYVVDGDWSSASYWLVAAALGQNIEVEGLSFSSKQADKALLDMLLKANCRIDRQNEKLKIDGNHRTNFVVDATDCPDLFPALTVLAVFTTGISRIKGVHRLLNKESNRAATLLEEFQKIGAIVKVEGDELVIDGGKKLHFAEVDAHNDHRIAMSLAIASIVGNLGLTITGAESVSKSYPAFWKDLECLKQR